MDNANGLAKKIIAHFNGNNLGYVWRQNNIAVKGRMFIGERGLGDVVGLLKNGKHIEFEVKIEKDKLSQAQINHREIINTMAGFYFEVKTFNEYLSIVGEKQ